jgi:RimJ/RimL family protein N-acetyltransferase
MGKPSSPSSGSGHDAAEIRTARLTMRRARPSDLDAIHAILSDAEAMRYWSTPPHREVAQSREWLEAMIAAGADGSDDYVIEHDGRVIGKAGCWRLPEIGYILHPSAWGRGLGHEALVAIIARIFAERPLAEIVADVDPRNCASLKLLAKLGFVETGRAQRTIEVGGAWCDSVFLSLKREVAIRAPD